VLSGLNSVVLGWESEAGAIRRLGSGQSTWLLHGTGEKSQSSNTEAFFSKVSWISSIVLRVPRDGEVHTASSLNDQDTNLAQYTSTTFRVVQGHPRFKDEVE
jgi:hypothetical protein